MQTNFSSQQLADPATASCESVIRKCVHCGFCLATCPTYTLLGDENDSPRGRIYLMKQMLETDSKPSDAVVKHVDRCLSCLSCMTTCPSGVNYMHLVDHARAYIEARYQRPLSQRLIRSMIAFTLPYPKRFRAALVLARLAQPLKPLLERFDALKPLAAMLAKAPRTPSRTNRPGAFSGGDGAAPAKRGRVVLLQGCVESTLRPEIRVATVRLLTRAGYEVVLAKGEGCCGALVHHMGREAQSLESARRNIDAWVAEQDRAGLEAIVITASGCGTTIKDYGFMLRTDPAYADKAARVSALAKDICELLDTGGLPASGHAQPLNVAYHSACSMQHGQRITAAPLRLLTQAGFKVRQPADSHLCCGSAGVYNILQPEIASQLGERKASQLERVTPDVIATGNIGCLMQISSYTTKPIVHTVELLDWATGGPAPEAMQGSSR
jgi:glycolate oxidase iron-sulfur subunit